VSPTRRLLGAARIARGSLVAAVILGVAAALLAVVQAWLLATSIAGAVTGGLGLDALAPLLAALAVVLAARATLGWAADVTAQRISGTVKADLRARLLGQAVLLGPRWAADQASGELVLLATRGLDALDGYFGRYLPQVALGAVVPVVVVVALLGIDTVSALTVAVTVPLIPVFMVLIGKMSAAHRTRRWATLGRLAHRFGDVVAGLPTLRAYGAADAQVAILRRITDGYRTTTMATLRIAFLSAMALELLATISVALIAVGIGLRLAAGMLTLDVGLFALILAPEAYLPLRRLGAEFHASEEGATAAARAFAIIDAEPPEAGGALAVPAPLERLVVEGVSVAQPGRDVLAPAGASFHVQRGEVVALTGPSGCGKSTLLAVVLGMLVPSAGSVVVRGGGAAADVRSLDADAWRGAVAWVPQVPYLFAGSVADNICLGARGPVSIDDVADALARVGLADVTPDLVLGERGAGLSSGQRRRVGIARALVRRTPVLLLDEPTAGLDDTAEAAVLHAVREAADGGAAVLLVAHRPGAISGADRAVAIGWAAMEPVLDTAGGPLEPGGPASGTDAGTTGASAAGSGAAASGPGAANTGPGAATTGPGAANTGPGAATTGPGAPEGPA
jgi:thiol reductant ABC exporter CydD subunit